MKPRIIDVQNISPIHAKVTMEPFERGYGHTLGNALRRILLSSMPGYAPTEVKITGVLHEYSTIDGVQEDVVDILLNLKGIVLKLHNREEALLTLKKQGEGVVTAGDIEVIARRRDRQSRSRHRASDRGRQARHADQGRARPRLRAGHRRASADEGCRAAIGSIMLDASFSPVRRVSYAVESARVEQRTDLDKLIIDIETNGAIEPEEAIRYAARILVDQLPLFADI